MAVYIETACPRFRQGDVLRDVVIVTWAEEVNGELSITTEQMPYCVVLTQECDLEQDYTNRNDPERYGKSRDKVLPSILLCPAYPAAQLKDGSHLQAQDAPMQKMGRDDWRRVIQNNNYRYHYLPENADRQVPELVLDFKRYLTVPREVAYRPEFKGAWLVSLGDLFREHLSSRFAHYLSRIGLPEPDEQSA
ncbi:hypothetical protein [Burkholderia pseudomallei]|uniref:hypothetical protein n=1 Tax=Burkholderia pseudomallei TaxID=28450 RepID=UPI0011AB6BBC|nr:hypothetical protein [Burkholderia pseudomallei]